MFEIFNPVFEAIARLLAFYYELPVIGGSYGFAIILLTISVMLVLMPLTLKATRSTIAMQFVQPELKALQKKYKDDRPTLNEETMKLYREKGINPVGGCIPILAQLPVFLVLYRVFIGLTTRNSESAFFGIAESARASRGIEALDPQKFDPKWIPTDSVIYSDLVTHDSMPFGPLDLAAKTADVFQENPFAAIPYLFLIVATVAGSYYQQRQVSARRDGSPMAGNPMQQQLMRVMPLMSGVWGFLFPAALVLYWVTSSMFRIAQQSYITKSFYRGEDSIGKKAANAVYVEKDGDAKSSTKDTSSKSKNKATPSDKVQDKKKKKSKASSNGSGSAKDRSQAWAERRAQKAKAQKSRSNGNKTSGRVTPKGTKSSAASKKRKR